MAVARGIGVLGFPQTLTCQHAEAVPRPRWPHPHRVHFYIGASSERGLARKCGYRDKMS